LSPARGSRSGAVPVPAEMMSRLATYQEEHEGAGPLDVPEMAVSTKEAEELIKLAWGLLESGTAEAEAVTALRLKAGSDVKQIRIAECKLRSTGFVAENFDYYGCWCLLCRATGEIPAPLPLENQRLAEAVDQFLQLGLQTQFAFLATKVSGLAELLEAVRADYRAEPSAGTIRRLVGPGSRNTDPLVRSHTARQVVENRVSQAATRSRAREQSSRRRNPRR
jgi:hypothetical protein